MVYRKSLFKKSNIKITSMVYRNRGNKKIIISGFVVPNITFDCSKFKWVYDSHRNSTQSYISSREPAVATNFLRVFSL